ncbi:DUF6578 domain-containing protein [Microterricola viridarii]|uniref:Uncharacterized protein n=1 Tax=Microterricola viridarii TaxID=412690 RepID=A0A0X8E3F8_9MICO|nr:DUF6578 domain-containing protein [Microterricola viridarii]AMB59032.1 hypothetical protein AWU67_09380 [Microterricola viridarii]
MRIEVVIASWEQGCCGVPIGLGDTATYNLVAFAPALGGASAVPRFFSDNHGQTPSEVPQARVAGVVAAITGVSYPRVPVAGQAGTFTSDPTRPQLHPLSSIGDEGDDGLSEYLVLLDVADGTDLPHFVLAAERTAHQEREARTDRLRELRSRDEVGVLLRALADDAALRFGALARIVRSDDASAFSILPERAGAAALHWLRSAEEGADGIRVQLGDGVWEVPADPVRAEVLREFLDAAAAGRVEEQRPEHGDEMGPFQTVVTAADGRRWVATTDDLARFGIGGVFAMTGPLARRLERGTHRYVAWE